MGQMKRFMEDLEGVRYEAIEIAIRVGWMSRCEICDEVTMDDTGEEGHAYASANWRVKNGKTDTSREDLKAALDHLKEATPHDCRCEHYRDV